MVKLTKRMKLIHNKIDSTKQYHINKAILAMKEMSNTKFIESVDVAINLGIDPRQSDQNIRNAVTLPHGTGKNIKIAVFAEGTTAKEAKDVGADIVGMDDLIEKIKKRQINFDMVIASPEIMHIVCQVGQILGPRGLMPNSKDGTISSNIIQTIKNIKSGQINYHNDKNGIVHCTIGKINFESFKIKENLETLISSIKKIKPIKSKGIYIKKIHLSTTMGIGILINQSSLFKID